MKFTLKDYQNDAVRDVLDRLRRAARRWREEGEINAFSLSAATGAGKTVIAAAIIEALFYGDETFEFDADPSATVIWFSDSPDLNEQSRFRLHDSSDRLDPADLVIVQNTFNQETFSRGKVYFLNTQKLSKSSLLTRGYDPEDVAGQELLQARPDNRSHTIWDTIQNTVEDPSLTLYLVLDEAHRGMGNPSRSAAADKSTIVQRLINGTGSVPPIPIAWGISATVERFNQAMASAVRRSTLPSIEVDAARVQESGLLKDTINLDVPAESGQFDTVLLRRATDKIKDSSEAWVEYARRQGDTEPVKPLMILQVPNTPDPKAIGQSLDTVFQHWPELPIDAVRHVFGEHSTQTFGNYNVPYISPEWVQETSFVRILIAKDAISTGWDCPRAEVMVSFRPAKDRTYITQLLGRMVRTPLARRIPGNDRLNSVDCLLPSFDRKTVESVVNSLLYGGDDDTEPLPGRRVLINPTEMTPNPEVPESVRDRFLSLPSQSLPQRGAKPVKRLTALAHELAVDGLLDDAGKLADAEMRRVLDAAKARYAPEIAAARGRILTVEGKSLRSDLTGQQRSFDDFVESADEVVINEAYRRASRVLGGDIVRTYAMQLAAEHLGTETEEDALINAHLDVAALGLVPEVKNYLESEADQLARGWFTDHRVAIKSLSDKRQDAYREIKGMSTEPEDVDLVTPRSRLEPTTQKEADGAVNPIPVRKHHLLSDSNGDFPLVRFNEWETEVLDTEMCRSGFVAWYRNPSRASQDSLAIAYDAGNDEIKSLRPDFIFFSESSRGVEASIVDPHGTHLGDALPKLRGLAHYAQQHGSEYQRIEAVAKVGDTLRVLDLTDQKVRTAVADAQDVESLYNTLAVPY